MITLRRSLLLLIFGGCGAVSVQMRAQEPAPTDKLPTYDVATVKPNKTGSGHSHIWEQDNTYRTENVSLKVLLRGAFGVQQDQITGLPPWADSARFDISAKVLEPDLKRLEKLTGAQRRAMLQALYTERFGLKWHYETRVLPGYELVIAKGGQKLTAASKEEHTGVSVHNTALEATGVPVSRLADVLSDAIQRPVVDKTGLTGNFNYTLKWSPDDVGSTDRGAKDADAPPVLFTALQEQLGLRLQSGKEPVQVVVIDQVQEPTEN
jgi:uncharacterized protein (TIGR03435 family)